MHADVFQRMRELLDKREDRQERQAWAELAGKARAQWAQEELVLMFRPGDIGLVDTDASKLPVILVWREE